MPVPEQSVLVNRLLAGLPAATLKAILTHCETIDLQMNTTRCERGELYAHVYFPLSGFLSLATLITGHPPLEMRLIGNEGMLGGTLALGVPRAPQRVMVQGAGTALRMTTCAFSTALADHACLSRMINRYLYVVFEQLAQTAACNRFHDVESRLARRLLMSDDRARNAQIHLTHQNLADFLGVLRSAVTIAAGNLHKRGLIYYSRGEITVLDRAGLEANACECYANGIAQYEKLNS